MMNAKEAYGLITKFYPDHDVTGGVDYKNLFVFGVMPKNRKDGEMIVDALRSVDKQTGKISTFSPLSDMDEFMKSPRLNIDTLRK